MIDDPDYGCRSVNVMAQRADRDSLLTWFTRLISVRRERLAAVRAQPVRVAGVGRPAVSGADGVEELFRGDDDAPPVDEKLRGIELQAIGYRWIRLLPSLPAL